MSEILNLPFTSDVEGFSAGTWVDTQGSAGIDTAAGALQIGAGVTATKDFTNITSGHSRLDFWWKTTGTANSATLVSTFIYLMANGVTLSSGDSLCTLALDRSTTNGAGTTNLTLRYRNTSGGFTSFAGTPKILRGDYYYKISVVFHHTAKTFDVYFGDILWQADLGWPNTGAAGFGRIGLLAESSADSTWLDNIVVTSDWADDATTLINHDFVGGSGEIEASTPTTDNRNANAQPWKIADNTSSYGAFTLGANGGTPDASSVCFALQRVSADGIVEAEYKSSVAGAIYFGIFFRFWDYPSATGAGGGIFRISGTSWILQLPDRSGAIQTVQSGTITAPSANTTYTLKIETRGRYVTASYKAAAMDSGSYTQLVKHQVTDSATGGRGMLSEEYAGPLVVTTIGATDNYLRRFRATGGPTVGEFDRTIGGYSYEVAAGSIRALYSTAAASPTRNLFLSKGIQYGHRSSADSCGSHQSATIYDSTNVLSVHQIGANITEYEYLGHTDCYVTLLRRGPWIMDGLYVSKTGENFAPDLDLRGELWSKSFFTVANTGSATSRSDSSYHDWTSYGSIGALPRGNQSLTAFGSGTEARMSQVLAAITNTSGSVWETTSKFEGSGDPISRAIAIPTGSLSAATNYRVARAFLLEANGALSASVLEAFRDDVGTPASIITFVSGSLKTDATGDLNTDGFNERHGWYEIACAGGLADFTLPVASGTRYMPAFRLNGWTNTNTAVTIGGVLGVAGMDYVLDDLGGSVGLLQLLTNRTGDTTISLAAGVVATEPDAPTIGTATKTGSTTATVSFSAPLDNGGSVVTSYIATSTPGGIAGTLVQEGSGTITVTGLSPSTSYTFKVQAVNAIGTGSESAASNSITTDAGGGVDPAPTPTLSFGRLPLRPLLRGVT